MNFTVIAGLGPDNSISYGYLAGTPQTSQTPPTSRALALPELGFKDSGGDKGFIPPKPSIEEDGPTEMLGEELDR